jgi:superfamily I DNA and/or RNA helicase
MEYQEANRINNVWTLTEQDRFRLYRYWQNILVRPAESRLKNLGTEYNAISERIQEAYIVQNSQILEDAVVIGMTTTGAAKYSALMSHVKPIITIVEEAAEVLEAHIITVLSPESQHLILIGDHQQLKPSTSVYKLALHYNLDVSLFERMVNNDMECCQLNTQHRMRPEISQLITPHIYKTLFDHETVHGRPDIGGIDGNIFFINHNMAESVVPDSTSRSNRHEAVYLVRLVLYLRQQGYKASQITVLTTYLGQAYLIKRIIAAYEQDDNYPEFDKEDRVLVTPVDNYQGEENDIILLSCVRSNNDLRIGFLNVSNRVCVALSRAKDGFYVIGNFDLLRCVSRSWRHICRSLDRQSRIVTGLPCYCQNHPETAFIATDPEDFDQAPKGGVSSLVGLAYSVAMLANFYATRMIVSTCNISARSDV